MITSIQIKKETKDKLNKLKKTKSDSYETVINRLLAKELVLKEELIEGYTARSKEHKELNKEWENADTTWR
ncbi:MAG: hypothetical protein ACMXX9_03970 [Candidatus Woesearchaeota archaeon]